MNMRRILSWLLIAAFAFSGSPRVADAAAPSPAASPTPAASPSPAQAAECRMQSGGERPSGITDDIVNCVVVQAAPTRVRLTVNYTYASPLGNRGIWMGIDVLARGNRLKWFAYRPAAITGSSGTATLEIVYGQNSPPRDQISTDQIELFMYVGGGQIFYRKMFALKHDWKL
jgi:hypothetical protein